MYKKTCPVCGKEFETKYAWQIYHNRLCAKKAYRDRPANKKAIRGGVNRWIDENRERYLARKRKYNKDNRDKINKQKREILRLLKTEVISAYGGRCECCGESAMEFLTIDHVNGGGTKHRKVVGAGGTFYYWLRRNNYPSGYRVLCMNCNCSYGSYGYCPHKTKKDFKEIS